ncbi:phosphatase 1 regulatory subunit 3B [Fusarium oxysporum]|nr:phosphatase 1 regulatory subunit 3B [Fusarium oxysporum]
MTARSDVISAPAMPLRSRSPTQQYRGVTSICSITEGDSTLHTSKDNGIFQPFGKNFKTFTDLKECARRILRLNTLPSQPTSKKKPQGDPQHGNPNCTANERVTLNQQHTGGLSCASSATTLSYAAIVTTDVGSAQRGGEKIQQQSRPAMHLFGDRRSAKKRPSFKTVHFDPNLEHVRYFSNADKPLTLGATNQKVALSPQWEIFTPNFRDDDSTRKPMDTVSETPAKYYRASSSRSVQNYVKFVVGISLFDADELDSSPLFFYVRYIVNGQEYWDDNSGVNFEVDFRRKLDSKAISFQV